MKTMYAHKKLIVVVTLLVSFSLVALPILATGIYPNKEGQFWARGGVNWDGSTWTGWMESNLFGFGHMFTPSGASITDWQALEVHYYGREMVFTGTFTIDVPSDWGGGSQPGYTLGGKIYVKFTSVLDRIPLMEGEPNGHIHFSGPFRITGGTGQYSNLGGTGEISGTIHRHAVIDVEPPYYDIAMIGRWRA